MKKLTFSHIVHLFVLMALCLSACGALRLHSAEKASGGWIDWDGDGGWSGSDSERSAVFEGEPSTMLSPPMDAGSDASIEAEERSMDRQAANLRAGSVDDNAQWDDYLLYRLRAAEWGLRVHEIDVTERHILQVRNAQGQPVLGALVTVYDDQGQKIADLRTHSDGQALFFPNAYGSQVSETFEVRVSKGPAEERLTFQRNARQHTLTLDASSAAHPVRLDVHFLIDATGSMSDEILQLKENMIEISRRIDALPSQPNVRFGMTIYRDRGDLFVSRSYDFNPDVQDFTDELERVTAEGGGDYPESLNEGLHHAIHLPEWRLEDTVSLIILVADAPPHLDYANDYDYALEVFAAVENGIKIYPIASSGLDDQGEYIFRQLAQVSGGKFLFLTYGAGGAPGDDTVHHVDDYSVLSLDELVVRLIEEELAHQSSTQ